MLHGPQKNAVKLSFSLPSDCAEEIERGASGIGLVPVVEIARQELEVVPGVGITCCGAVRSILLFSRVPWRSIRTLAADCGSRTSVELARVILREQFGVQPYISRAKPALDEMLWHADAALIIGDPALHIEPDQAGYEWLDLGAEWFRLTHLPFVFAAWSGKPGIPVETLSALTVSSHSFGNVHLADIVECEHRLRGIRKDLAHRYLTEHIRFVINKPESRGLEAFLELANLKRPDPVGKL
jgi:chorismate dehydratase